MTVTSGTGERLQALVKAGTSPWLDQIRRSLIEQGELKRMEQEDSLRGVTSNPAIFEKAILGSTDYDDQLKELAEAGKGPREIYEAIAIKDVQLACDVLRETWDQTEHVDGYVSLEVMPDLAHETEQTLAQARDYWKRVDRPNLMIKIPGTDAGLPAIEQAISEGININVTLLFSVEAYTKVADAFIKGLETRKEKGESLDIHSVASFFVSRVDSAVDKKLEELGRRDLLGTAAITNARAAYVRFKEIFLGERFAALKDAGAPVQRPLWASTGVKNPHYDDTMYVAELIAPHTVNTMPMPTLIAFADHGEVRGATADVPAEQVERELKALADAGIDMNEVTDKLLADGVRLFDEAMDKLIAGVESSREAVVTGRPPAIESVIPDEYEPKIAARIKKAADEEVTQRIWRKDPALWGTPDTPEISNRLGWLTISESMLDHADELQEFAKACVDDGLTDAVLLGMGGSSLGPEVLRRSFGAIDGALKLHVLDSTDPGAVLETERAIDLTKTLFIVSSKSGGTIETLSQFKYFHAKVLEAVGTGGDAGSHFVAVTDPGSGLADLAEENDFRAVFLNDPDIGGRYSVLSYFGIVPAVLMGVDIKALLERAQIAEQACANYDHSSNNSGLWLGCALGELALQGRDKVTFVVDEPVASFGLWVEQLIAESLGKHGKGALPVAGEPLKEPGSYGNDRVFIHLKSPATTGFAAPIAELGKAGHPVFTMEVEGPIDLGRIFFFAEFATAVAGWVLEINPFDQPNVQEAKDNTKKVLDSGEVEGPGSASDDELRELVGKADPPHYFAIMAYVKPSDDFDAAAAELREPFRCATTFGYGPRFLHSTGQYHKGGPKQGLFLQVLHDGAEDVEIPGDGLTFRTLKNAQATGDLETLRSHGLPAERVRLEGDDPVAALRALNQKIKEMMT